MKQFHFVSSFDLIKSLLICSNDFLSKQQKIVNESYSRRLEDKTVAKRENIILSDTQIQVQIMAIQLYVDNVLISFNVQLPHNLLMTDLETISDQTLLSSVVSVCCRLAEWR